MPDNQAKKERDIKKSSADIRQEIDELMKQTRGYGIMTQDNLINPDIIELNTNNISMDNNKSLEDGLMSIKGKDKLTQERMYELFYADMYSKNEKEIKLDELLRPRNIKNLEYNYILSNMVEMTTALETLAEDVVFPNSGLESGIKIEFIGNKDVAGERDSDLEKFFRPNNDVLSSLRAKRLYNFDIEEVTKDLVFNIATYGYQIAYTVPYKAIATDLLFNASKEKDNDFFNKIQRVGEAYYTADTKAFGESLHDLYDTRVGFSTPLTEKEEKIYHTSTFENYGIDVNKLFTDTPYSSEDVDELINYMENTSDLFVEDNTVGLGEFTSSNNMLDNLVDLKNKKNKKFLIDNIKGSTFEFLDINKIQPVFIKNELIGCFLVDSIPDNNKYRLGNTLSNVINSSSIDDGIQLQDNYKKVIKDVVFKDVQMLLRRNIDKTLLRNNPNLIEDIEWLLDDDNSNIQEKRIRFIPSEYITFFKNGRGLLGQSMLEKGRVYALMHIQLNKAESLNKVYLNKPRMKVAVHDVGNVDSQSVINKVGINYARNAIPRLTDVGIPDTMTSSILANYQTIVVHKNKNGDEGFDIENIPLEEPRDNSEYLRYLRNQATLSLGYPADLLDPSQNLDFAKKITQINLKTQSKVLAMQKQLELPLSELCTRRIRYMTGKEDIEVKIEFVRPKELDDNVTLEALDKVQRKTEMYELIIDNNTEIKDNEKAIMKMKIAKKLLEEFLDMSLLEKTHHETIVEGELD